MMGMEGMMYLAWIVALVVVLLLGLAGVALVKYLFFGNPK